LQLIENVGRENVGMAKFKICPAITINNKKKRD